MYVYMRDSCVRFKSIYVQFAQLCSRNNQKLPTFAFISKIYAKQYFESKWQKGIQSCNIYCFKKSCTQFLIHFQNFTRKILNSIIYICKISETLAPALRFRVRDSASSKIIYEYIENFTHIFMMFNICFLDCIYAYKYMYMMHMGSRAIFNPCIV